jgi:hypothetical protein
MEVDHDLISSIAAVAEDVEAGAYHAGSRRAELDYPGSRARQDPGAQPITRPRLADSETAPDSRPRSRSARRLGYLVSHMSDAARDYQVAKQRAGQR